MKIIICTLLSASLLNAAINKAIFDIDGFKNCLSDYQTTQAGKIKENCFTFLKDLVNSVPDSLKSTYEAIIQLTRSVFDTADVIYGQQPDPTSVKTAIEKLVKEQESTKQSLLIAGNKYHYVARVVDENDQKEIARHNDMQKQLNDIFDALSSIIFNMTPKSINHHKKIEVK